MSLRHQTMQTSSRLLCKGRRRKTMSACNEVLLTREEWCPSRQCVTPYVHYRLVLETLGQPLDTFKSTRQLCEVIRDAIVGKEYRSL